MITIITIREKRLEKKNNTVHIKIEKSYRTIK